MREHDPIPMLPAMPHRPRPGRRRSNRSLLIVVVSAAVAAVVIMAIGVWIRVGQMADETFNRAQESFRNSAFAQAELEFALFHREHPRDPRAAQAKTAEELSQLAQQLGSDVEAALLIEKLDEFAESERAEISEYWPVIMTLAERTARQSLEKAQRTLDLRDLETGKQWLAWLKNQKETESNNTDIHSELEAIADQVRSQIELQAGRKEFITSAEAAIAGGKPATFAQALQAFDRLGEPTSEDAEIHALYENLRQAMRDQVRFSPPKSTAETPEPVPRLPLEPYTLLSSVKVHHKPAMRSTSPFFVRAKDLCFAIDPASGSARWVLRVGYDADMPELITDSSQAPVALVPWFRYSTAMLSLCDVATGEAIWTWQAPDLLVGPPIVSRGSVFAATRRGEIWQLALATGDATASVQLPESIDSPLALRQDREGFVATGSRQGVYLFELSGDEPQCSDVVLIGRRPDSQWCRGLWASPYLLIFENDLVGYCHIRVLFRDRSGYRPVHERRLDGRVWQPPALIGPHMFLITDQLRTHYFGVDPANPAVNLYTAATGPRWPDPSQPIRPYFTHIDELPIVTQSTNLHGYRVDTLQSLMVEVWSRQAPHGEARGTQPLQSRDSLVLATWQLPESDGILVQAFSASSGQVAWEASYGVSANRLASLDSGEGRRAHLVATRAGNVVELRDGTAAQSRPTDLPRPSSPIYALESRPDTLVYAADQGGRILHIAPDRSIQKDVVQKPHVESALALWTGSVAVSGDEPETLAGEWISYVTEDRTVEFRNLSNTDELIHGAKLPTGKTAEPWRWGPVMFEGSSLTAGRDEDSANASLDDLYVAHPSGVVARVELRRTEKIPHLFIAEQRVDLPALAAPPIAVHSEASRALVCVATTGQCLVIDSKTLRTLGQWQLAAPASEALGAGSNIFLRTEDGTVHAMRWQGAESVATLWTRSVGTDARLFHASADDAPLMVATPDRIVGIRADGELAWSRILPAPLSADPHQSDAGTMIATMDGGLFFFSDEPLRSSP